MEMEVSLFQDSQSLLGAGSNHSFASNGFNYPMASLVRTHMHAHTCTHICAHIYAWLHMRSFWNCGGQSLMSKFGSYLNRYLLSAS